MNHRLALALTASTLALGACAHNSAVRVVSPATPDQQRLLFEQVKGLEGEWTMTDEKGTKTLASVFKVSSNGSVVRETMFPGSEHEMTNVYHMDGPTLVMTHYCAAGNQPRMRASAGEAGVVDLRFDSVTNLKDADEPYMGELRLVIGKDGTLREEWKSLKRGQVQSDHSPAFVMTRK